MKNTKYIFFFPLTLLLLSSTACSKHTPTAAEINESIAQEKALKESQAAEEAKAAEDAKSQEDDKFLTEFGKAEKEEEEAKAIIDEMQKENQAMLESIENGEMPENEEGLVIADASSIPIGRDFAAVPNISDVANSQDTDLSIVKTDNNEHVIYDVYELEDEYYYDIVQNIKDAKYSSLDEINQEIDTKYASYPDEVKNELKSGASEAWTYWDAQLKEIANQPNPWTAEELEADPDLKYYTREQVEAEKEATKDIGGTRHPMIE